jgi:hypothetical protein
MSYINPKTNWAVNDNVGTTDFNRIEGNILDLHMRDGNLSFEYDTDNDGIPDGYEWTPYDGGTIEIDTASIDGQYCVKITHPGGAGKGGGQLLLKFFPIQSVVNYLYITFGIVSSIAGIRNNVDVLFYDGGKNFLSSRSIYDSTANPTSPALFLSQIPAIPTAARWFRLRLTGGNSSTTTGGTTRFDCIKILDGIAGQSGILPTFGEVSKYADSNWTDAAALPLSTLKGFRIGHLPCTVTTTIQCRMNAVSWGYVRLRCGLEYGAETRCDVTTYTGYSISVTLSDANMINPPIIYVQYRIEPSNYNTMYVQRNATAATITPTNGW